MFRILLLFGFFAAGLAQANPRAWDDRILISQLAANKTVLFCNAGVGKFDIGLSPSNELEMKSLIYGGLLRKSKFTDATDCDYSARDRQLTCKIDNFKRLEVDLQMVFEIEAQDKVGDRGDRFQTYAQISKGLGGLRSSSEKDIVCVINKK